MIISHRHRFIFVKTRKTAGTSLQDALENICGAEDIVTPTGDTNERYRARHFRGLPTPLMYLRQSPRRHRTSRIGYWAWSCTRIHDHMFLDELFALPESQAWRGYFRFAVERNPWDKVVSRYYWKYRERPTRPDFDRFVRKDKLNSDFNMYSLDGKLAVDYVCRYENLESDLNEIGRLIGCKVPSLGHLNAWTRDNRDYRKMYSDASRAVVAKHFSREIELFNFEFG
jgi:Sulfotransferase family